MDGAMGCAMGFADIYYTIHVVNPRENPCQLWGCPRGEAFFLCLLALCDSLKTSTCLLIVAPPGTLEHSFYGTSASWIDGSLLPSCRMMKAKSWGCEMDTLPSVTAS